MRLTMTTALSGEITLYQSSYTWIQHALNIHLMMDSGCLDPQRPAQPRFCCEGVCAEKEL